MEDAQNAEYGRLLEVGDSLARMVETAAGHGGPEVCGRHAEARGKTMAQWCTYCEFVALWRKLRAEFEDSDG